MNTMAVKKRQKMLSAEEVSSAISLAIEKAYPDRHAEGKHTIVFLHGWASDSRIWGRVSELLSSEYNVWLLDLPGYGLNENFVVESPEGFLAASEIQLGRRLPDKFSMVGWSLGGALASLIAHKMSDRVKSLHLIGTNPEFVASKDWSFATQRASLLELHQNLEDNSKTALERFWFLQFQHEVSKANLRHHWRDYISQFADTKFDLRELHKGLNWLQSIKLHKVWDHIQCPVFHYLGEHDPFVSAQAASNLKHKYTSHHFSFYSSASHLPFLSARDLWLADFLKNICSTSCPSAGRENVKGATAGQLDKRAVTKGFSRSASRYNNLAGVQLKVAKRLIDAAPPLPAADAPLLLDIGSGTGYVQKLLPQRERRALVQLDIASEMLEIAKGIENVNGEKESGALVQADMDQLPFVEQAFDRIYANFAFQWSADIEALFSNAYMLLSPGGLMLFSTVLPGSLNEIVRAWKNVDACSHVNSFLPSETLQEMAVIKKFEEVVWQSEVFVESFATAQALLASVSGIGAGNHLTNRSSGLLGVSRYKKLLNALEDEDLQLTYKVLLAQLRKPLDAGS